MVYTIRVYANRTKNGGRRLPDVEHECYGKLSIKSVLKCYNAGTDRVFAKRNAQLIHHFSLAPKIRGAKNDMKIICEYL